MFEVIEITEEVFDHLAELFPDMVFGTGAALFFTLPEYAAENL
jgi:hypothetical protein